MRYRYLLILVGYILICIPNLYANDALLAQEYYFAAHCMQNKSPSDAIDFYKKSIFFDNSHVQSHIQLAHVYYKQHLIDEALSHFHIAMQLSPHDAHIRFNLGLCYEQKQQWKEAAEEYTRTLMLDRNYQKAYIHAASAYEKIQLPHQAITILLQALDATYDSFDIRKRLGDLYRHIDQLEQAAEHYTKGLEYKKNNTALMMDLANCLHMLDRNEEALSLYQQIIEKNPHAISALYNFGFTLKKMGHLNEALAVYEKVLSLKPDYAHAHFSLASIYLSLGDYERGFTEYEWRWKAYGESDKKFNIPVWNGEDLTHKRLLVYAEQGLGDTLQFIRYIKKLKTLYRNLYVIFETQAPLEKLLKLQPYIDEVLPRKNPIPLCDYHIALMSIAHRLKSRIETVPAETPYLVPDMQRVAYWHNRLAHDKNFKIGLCWQGNARYSTQALRKAVASKSIPLELLKPLSTLKGVSLYSLQCVDGIDQLTSCSFKDSIIQFDETFDVQHGSFMDTAAVMKHLDLVISVDTGLCHLAGAMNIPTWIMLPQPSDWRWLIGKSDSHWYPSVRLFRQPHYGDWIGVVHMIMHSLQKAVIPQKNTPSHEPREDQIQFFESLLKTTQ